MTKLYTFTFPTTTTFLASHPPENIDLDQYVEQNIDVDFIEIPAYLHVEKSAIFQHAVAEQNISWALNFNSIENLENNLVMTIRSDEFYKDDYDFSEDNICSNEEVEIRLDIVRALGAQVTHQEI